VPADWRKKLAAVHTRAAELARQLPPSLSRAAGTGVPDAALLAADGEPVKWDYFRAVVVRDRIVAGAGAGGTPGVSDGAAEGEDSAAAAAATAAGSGATQGWFGRLAGKAKEWDDVVRSYERDSLHLPEVGTTKHCYCPPRHRHSFGTLNS